MNYKVFVLAVTCWLISFPFCHAQVYDQNKLFKMLPAIPSNLSTATDEEVSAFVTKCDSVSGILSGYQEKYKRTRDSETNSDLIMEYYDIRDSIMDLNSTMRNKYYDLVTLFSDLEYELSAKKDSIRELIDNAQYNGNKKEEVDALYEQIYKYKVKYSEKEIAIFLQFLKEYRYRLDNISEKANKSEIIPLPDHLNKDVSYVLINIKNYLNYLSEVYKFNVGQYKKEE
ncbi:MAG TPA: hypothetical protein VK172_06885 [Lentimicrobium sp.]|nr:hypothetical protein [Lentimicrobium sp.]